MLTRDDHRPRQLTHDERKAAEAAFQGWTFNNEWSQSALNVYIGIRAAMMKVNEEQLMQKVQDIDSHLLAKLRGGVPV